MRLNRYVAMATGLSRRQADNAIAEGRVILNSMPAVLGDQACPNDTILLDNITITAPETFQYLILNKPAGYVTSRARQGKDKTIYALLPEAYHRLKPVGRLDRETSGLLLLTDDGEAAFELSHPSHVKTKRYEVVLDRVVNEAAATRLRNGVELEDGLSQFDSLSGKGKNWQLTLHEGRNRQIRRTFSALSFNVLKLHRTHFGKISLDGIPVGEFRLISKGDIA